MLTNLLKFLKGYLVIRLSGYSPERFLNLCGHHGIVLWGLRPVGTEYEMCISISGFRRLRPLVRKTRTRVVVRERHGLPFILHRYRSRKLFAAGAVGGTALLYVLSLFIWNIQVEGNYSLSDQVILDYLETEQVVHGMRKSEIHGEEIEALLREHFPEITWTSAEVKGTRLIVHVKENGDTVTAELSEEEPADLVAARSGTVESIIVRSGTPVVSVGDAVEAGDVLVESRVEVLDDNGEVANAYYVHADADILICYTADYEATFSMNYVQKVYTGRTHTTLYAAFGIHRLGIGLPFAGFDQFDAIASEFPLRLTENFYLPFSFGKVVQQEYARQDAVYTQEEAETHAQEELELFFEKLRIKGIQIIENNVKIRINGDICTASGTYTAEESAVTEKAPTIVLPTQEEPQEEREQT